MIGVCFASMAATVRGYNAFYLSNPMTGDHHMHVAEDVAGRDAKHLMLKLYCMLTRHNPSISPSCSVYAMSMVSNECNLTPSIAQFEASYCQSKPTTKRKIYSHAASNNNCAQ